MTAETATRQKWEVRTPVADYNGVTYGQVFRDGRTVVEDEEVARVLQEDFGYMVTPPIPEPAVRANHPDPARAERPAHPIEDAGRTYPFYPREASLPPGADPLLAVPPQSRGVREEIEADDAGGDSTEVTTDGEVN